MTYREWIESMEIFAKYEEKGLDSYPIQRARHQQLGFGCPKELLSLEDKARLEELGWWDDDSYGMLNTFM